MLWHKYPDRLDAFTLAAACEDLQGDPPGEIPFLVWLLENPASPLNMPGSIDLLGHDRIHLLLKKGFSPAEEAYVIGFTMGNDTSTNWWHLLLLKIAAHFLYPPKYRLSYSELSIFDRGVQLGRSIKVKNINKLDWSKWDCKLLQDIRQEIGLEIVND
ncbi:MULTISPECIES: hypothetical protein [unclassified Chamaesiphon]|uniref:hypothetical protein n=1 Tax=unclassified Chamaesiphon TaxID=2620921 RepID=UPI00286B84D9|nr:MULTISPECIES: hypothetical protein [unclassified Chamaesiphon]